MRLRTPNGQGYAIHDWRDGRIVEYWGRSDASR
ncbi:hypothetical protein BH10ACT6_BH10ACT6_00730 [soil metagenome]